MTIRSEWVDAWLPGCGQSNRKLYPVDGAITYPVQVQAMRFCHSTSAGATGLTRALVVKLGPERITVNCVCLGPIFPGLTTGALDANKNIYVRRHAPLRRSGRLEEITQMTLSLSLPASSHIAGATIPVAGGLMARNA
jgi:NAD(P)-dependent dehydrogenase (short-subunit alcohol dehydrogenase family)